MNTVFANKSNDEGINVTTDRLSSEAEIMKNISNSIVDIDKRLNKFSSADEIYTDKINDDGVLIDLETENIFNQHTRLKPRSAYLPKEEEIEAAADFTDKNNVIDKEKTDNEFIRKNQPENTIGENIEIEVDKNRNDIKSDSSDNRYERYEKNNISAVSTVSIEQNNAVEMEEATDVLNFVDKDRTALREKAVADAREGLYDKSLSVLKNLYDSDKSDTDVAYDYMTILNWAGKYEEAVDVYENGKYDDVPDYVKINIAGAYYRLNLFENTEEIIQSLAKEGNKEAAALLAQTYLKENKIKEADDVYNELLVKYPDDLNIYVNRAQVSISTGNWLRAARDWNDVLKIYEENPAEKIITKEQILDNLSVAYIRIARFKEAGHLLEPYIKDKSASFSMVGNYIIVLNNTNQFKQAEKIYNEFFPDYNTAPVFATRELANSYIKGKNYRKAVDVYEYLINSPNGNMDDKFNLAYYACLSGVDKNTGIRTYRNILHEGEASKYTAKILNQAQDFLRKGYYDTAKDIYYELIKYDKRFHNIYADDLVKERQYQSALHEYYAMTEDAELKKQGIEGIVQTSVMLRDYKTAEDRLKQLDAEFKNISYDKAKGSFTNKQEGEVDFNVSNYSDYDDGNETDINVFVKQYVDDGFWIEGSVGKSYIKDVENNDTAVLNTNRVGVRYTARKWDTLLAWNMFGIDSGDKNGLYFETLFRPTDRQSVNFIYNYAPVYDVDALDYESGSIFDDNYILRYIYDLNTRESYYLELRQSDYSDDNKKYGWEIGQQYNIYNEREKKGRTLDRSVFWSRDRYSNQDVPYTSPKLSENIGAEWKWGLDLGNDDVLYYTLGANWKRDYPDELAFSPYIGIEYNKSIGNYNFYSISASYGWRTQNWLGEGGWDYDNKQIIFSYNITW